ncbi:MAG: hypothetical protein KJN89_11535 [Gammaproteobacteria bacterium]|nr:hypothetical protein [Gammaproteobacteria bacterium]NNJ50996.1 hypothetical protein [Gammaproteobacteria bacterium]
MFSINSEQDNGRMIRYGELHKALTAYTMEDIHEDIPIDYYRRVIKACLRANNHDLAWGVQQAASILLYLAFNDGHLQPRQLNANGLKVLDWSEKFLEQLQSDEHNYIISALVSA